MVYYWTNGRNNQSNEVWGTRGEVWGNVIGREAAYKWGLMSTLMVKVAGAN